MDQRRGIGESAPLKNVVSTRIIAILSLLVMHQSISRLLYHMRQQTATSVEKDRKMQLFGMGLVGL